MKWVPTEWEIIWYIYIYIYIYILSSTNCFDVSQLFSVAMSARSFKPRSKPVWLYINRIFNPISIVVRKQRNSLPIYFYIYVIIYQSVQIMWRAIAFQRIFSIFISFLNFDIIQKIQHHILILPWWWLNIKTATCDDGIMFNYKYSSSKYFAFFFIFYINMPSDSFTFSHIYIYIYIYVCVCVCVCVCVYVCVCVCAEVYPT